jgi:hypothetical protein
MTPLLPRPERGWVGPGQVVDVQALAKIDQGPL